MQLREAGRKLFYPLLRLGSAYNGVAKAWPMSTGVVTTVVKTSAADYFAQKVRRRVVGHLPFPTVGPNYGFSHLLQLAMACYAFINADILHVSCCFAELHAVALTEPHALAVSWLHAAPNMTQRGDVRTCGCMCSLTGD